MKIVVTGAGGMLGSDVVAIAFQHEPRGRRARPRRPRRHRPGAGRAADRPRAPRRGHQLRGLDRASTGPRRTSPRPSWSTARGRGSSPTPPPRRGRRCSTSPPTTSSTAPRSGPYTESDEPSAAATPTAEPSSPASAPRRTSTETASSSAPRGCSARAASNFVETMLRLGEGGGPVVVVHDQVGCPTYTGHLAAGLVRLIDGVEVRHPPHGRRAAAARGTSSRWRSSASPRS